MQKNNRGDTAVESETRTNHLLLQFISTSTNENGFSQKGISENTGSKMMFFSFERFEDIVIQKINSSF